VETLAATDRRRYAQKMMKIKPILEDKFYHDGRGPELQKVIWKSKGIILGGFEYYNPVDAYDQKSLKHLKLIGVQVYSMASEEVHGNIQALKNSNAAIWEIIGSKWLNSYQPRLLSECKHFQIMFYDEIYDIICKDIIAGKGKFRT